MFKPSIERDNVWMYNVEHSHIGIHRDASHSDAWIIHKGSLIFSRSRYLIFLRESVYTQYRIDPVFNRDFTRPLIWAIVHKPIIQRDVYTTQSGRTYSGWLRLYLPLEPILGKVRCSGFNQWRVIDGSKYLNDSDWARCKRRDITSGTRI